MHDPPDDGAIVVHRLGSVIRARVNGRWYEGAPFHRLIVTNGEYDPDARQWNSLPIISWQRVSKEHWREES